MWSWNQFRNLPRNQGLSPQEQARQYFIHQSNMMMEAASINNAAASSAAAGAGAGGSGNKKRLSDLLIFGIKNAPTAPPDDYVLFDLLKDGQTEPFTTDNPFYGPTVFADNTDDGFKYFVTRTVEPKSTILFGKMSNSGEVTYIQENLLSTVC